MITVLSFGINAGKNKVECAYDDAEKVYSLFKKIFSESFSSYNSICINNVNKNSLRIIIETVIDSINSNTIVRDKEKNTLVFYFSGHGEEKNGDLHLKLFDKSISITELSCCFEEYKDDILFVLDCCYSGMALRVANIESFDGMNNISVIASSSHWETSSFHKEKGSEFTNEFCNAINHLNENLNEISNKSVYRFIKQRGYNLFERSAYGSDIVLKNKYEDQNKDRIIKKFCEKVHTNDISQKEMLIYSIDNYPAIIKIRILENLIHDFEYEGSWIIRRAYGSILSNCNNISEQKEKFLKDCFDSNYWMIKCIALIGIRNDITPFRKDVEEIIEKGTVMDLIWLANLYFCDSKYKNKQISLKSNLAKTKWGLLEIYSHYKKDEDTIYEYIKDFIEDKSLLEKIEKQMELERNVISGSLIDSILKSKLRGKIKRQENKWLISNLFGYWRNYCDLDLKEYLETNTNKDIEEQLEEAEFIPKYDMRMSIFQYFNRDKENGKKYWKCLLWGISDEHPWVRREAAEYFKDYKEYIKDKKFTLDIDKSLYPGILDYYIILVKYGFASLDEINDLELTDIEKKAIKSYVLGFY